MAFDFKRTPPFRRTSPLLQRKEKSNDGVGLFVLVLVGVVLGLVLLETTSDKTTAETTTRQVINLTVTLPSAINGELTNLSHRDLVSEDAVTSSTNASQNWAANVTLTDGLSANGTKTVILRLVGTNGTNSTGGVQFINGSSANISYTANPYGFVVGSGGTILTLTILIGAIGVLIFVVVMFLKSNLFNRLLKR